MIHQVNLDIVKLPNLTKNRILSNFDLHGPSSKFDIFRVIAVKFTESRIVSSDHPEIREFATTVTQNTSDLEGQP